MDRDDEVKKEKSGLFGVFGLGKRPQNSEEEIKGMVADNKELLDDEKRMINDILDLGKMSVREIMTPRVDMMLIEDDETVHVALERMRGTGYSRIPVYHEEIDGIVGIVHFKDLIAPLMEGRTEDSVTKYMYEPMFVPETKDVLPLLSEMQEARQQMAIVVDEYGGTGGLITIEDIVEEIVGEIVDETDQDRALITALSETSWRVDGRFPVEDAEELNWPVEESEDYETIAGWLLDVIDSVPKVGDEFEIKGFKFKIEKMRRSRISSIRVAKVVE